MNEDLKHRTKKLALRVIRMFTALPRTEVARVLGKQVLVLALRGWQTVATVLLTNSLSMWTDTSASGTAQFYRAALLP